MIFKSTATITVILLIWGGQTVSHGHTNEQLIEITKKAFHDAKENYPGLPRKDKYAKAFQDSFKGIGAEKRTIALAHYLYDIDATNPQWAMSWMITSGTINLLAADPGFIDDWSYMRKMLAKEKDSRKFYLLSQLAFRAKPPNDDFVAARAHMLFANGSVSKQEGEYTLPYYNDVSMYAYVSIVENLRRLGADFPVPPEDIPHKEKARILAKWLKENWEGCENLEIPDESKIVKKAANNVSEHREERTQKRAAAETEPEQNENGANRYLMIGIVILSAIAVACFGLWRKKVVK